MCLARIWEVVETKDGKALVRAGEEEKEVLALKEVRPGDLVIVKGNAIVEVLEIESSLRG